MVAVLAHAAPVAAQAEPERVVLAGMPANLADATDTVLVPWRIARVRVARAPAADQDQARRDAKLLAARTRAGAVVWVARTPQGPTLWVYDASSGQLLSRPLPAAPPYDDPTAASVALSIKTLLRHSSVAPPAERIAPAAAVARLPSYTWDARSVLRLSRPGPDTAGWSLEPRLGLGVTWWPTFLPGRHGLALQVEAGPGQRIDKSGFGGRFYDVSAAAALRRHIALRRWLDARVAIVPMAGLSLHLARVSGELQPGRESAHVNRIVPSVDTALDVQARISRSVWLGLGLHAALMTRTQDYEFAQRPISNAPILLLSAGIAVHVSP
jgi:hypothetical protein